MKTLQELYKEIMASEKLKKDLSEAVNDKTKVTIAAAAAGLSAQLYAFNPNHAGESD